MTVDARKERFGDKDLKTLFKGATRLIVGRGKKYTDYNLKQEPMDAASLAKAVLGPTGNLRSPTLRVGKTYLVGFSEAGWDECFG